MLLILFCSLRLGGAEACECYYGCKLSIKLVKMQILAIFFI